VLIVNYTFGTGTEKGTTTQRTASHNGRVMGEARSYPETAPAQPPKSRGVSLIAISIAG
jgi:hypothetical protein